MPDETGIAETGGRSLQRESPPMNPYAPTSASDRTDEGGLPQSELHPPEIVFDRSLDSNGCPTLPRRTVLQSVLIWSFICFVSAAPSFYLGYTVTEGQIVGMLLGIATFVVAYTLLDLRTAHWTFRRQPLVRRTLKITYGVRVAISVFFPAGIFVDIYGGLISLTLLEMISAEWSIGPGHPLGMIPTYITTLLQGLTLNVFLAAFALLLLCLQFLLGSIWRALVD